MGQTIKAMIVDDSALIRNLVTKELTKSENIEVVGTAMNGRFALNKIGKLKPDIIILDLEMPEMNGIEFLKEKERLGITTPVIILSALAKKGAKITLEALGLGASDFILKPSEPGVNLADMGVKLVEMTLALAKPNSYYEKISQTNEPTLTSVIQKIKFDLGTIPELDINKYLQPIVSIPDVKIVSIGISTGGPNALREVLPKFPEDFPIPIIIVQHMPQGFTFEFANSLNKICKLPVKEASDGDILKQGRILIAPGNKHVKVKKKPLANIIELDESDPVNGHRPSADVLFESVAETYGSASIGCIMTGMGKDGALKIGKILTAGGITIAQDQGSSVVFGMPKVAIEKENIQIVKPLNKISEAIINLVLNKKLI